MKFIKRKNFVEGEILLYKPELHWGYLFKPVLQIVLIFLVLLLLKGIAVSADGDLFGFSGRSAYESIINLIFKSTCLGVIVIFLPVFILRVLQYINTEFGVTNKRLIIKKGIFRIFVAEIPTDRIESLYCIQGFWDRIFRSGTIYVSGIGGMIPTFFGVYRPYALRRKIVEIIEKNKTITVVHGNLPKPPPVVKPVPTVKEDPLYLFGNFVRVV
jgi:membrane protein YdbS with pleckstrin-like domain